ncbi:two-component response regulator fusion protein (N:response regulator receiver-C:HD-GAF domain protein) [Desulforapulum autotrophicum HRM2]|uniref:Two-component response regulator fusion protein (N:response regulator receiver-C:HD-GAF domain protein) n=1 Tax=Desulforapulum autotrophicum (strain ATCC 43914 / DSM 3382 / VKM B-1955 / HRM2) TaxID=177437 RepID=C0QMI5_DESAH|nr:HD domain-containing phosphohydrolase [Desulforapulum autotrophicum]ACN16502.1 two-component response regulator fusion protein (N:response regulator receiver-C:HD-GAF domain protein) [Desulforapulum autotrophicum HRM2]
MLDEIIGEMGPVNILVVDDEEGIRGLFKKVLKKEGYQCQVAENGEQALEIISKEKFELVISDIDMPVMNGIDLSKKILAADYSDIIVMTGQVRSYHYDEIINIGVNDFVTKPFSPSELILRVKRVLRERQLKQVAKQSHEELKQAYIDSIHRLVMASEFKDEDTGDHIVRIGKYSCLMAEKLGWPEKDIEIIRYASPMHDVGKIGIPDRIMLKPGKLTHEEFETMKTHTTIGAELLSKSKSEILKMARDIALSHHEKYNGKGYPNGLSEEKIPIAGRIVAIVDTFDALTSKRPYKEPYPPEIALDIIQNEKGKHFDPQITDLFMENRNDFFKIRETIGVFEKIDLANFMISERDKDNFIT